MEKATKKMEHQRKLTHLHVFFNLIYFSFSILKKVETATSLKLGTTQYSII